MAEVRESGASGSIDLGAPVGVYVDAARAAWPDLEVDLEAFAQYAIARVFSLPMPPLDHAGDLLLAFACVRRAPGAVTTFKRTFEGVMHRVLAHRQASDAEADDVAQIVYERLLVGTATSPPKIAEYRGHGPLRNWVSTNVATTLSMMRRSAKRRRERPHDRDIAATADAEPELLYLKQRHRAEIEAAIVRALAHLPERSRTLLRLHLGERLTIDHLGVMYRVNRATAARWVAAARDALASGARAEIKTMLRLSDKECDSLMTVMRSDLDVSVVRYLAGSQ